MFLSHFKTVIRAHVKNEDRLGLLKKTCQSWKDKTFHRISDLIIVDDGSPLQTEVKDVATKYGAALIVNEGSHGTCEGMAAALQSVKDEPYSLQLCDDILFGGEVREKVEKIINKELPLLGKWGAVSLFIPISVNWKFRTTDLVPNTKLHKCDPAPPLFHAWICTLISKELNNKYLAEWQIVKEHFPDIQDDHLIRTVCKTYDLGLYATSLDYALHTGTNNRAFNDPDKKQGASTYQCNFQYWAGSNEERKGY